MVALISVGEVVSANGRFDAEDGGLNETAWIMEIIGEEEKRR